MLKDKVILVTGGSRGIGKGIVEYIAAQGAKVAFTYLGSKERAEDLVAALTERGAVAKAYQSDASDFASAEALIKSVLNDFDNRLDAVVNNAGITQDNLLMRMTEEQWDKVLQVNLKSAFNLTKFATKPMMKQRAGSIINITSVVGISGNAGQSNYAASKAGMIGFTKSIAKELGSRNVRCNAIAPGFIETEMTQALEEKHIEAWKSMIPLKRAGQVEDVAKAVAFLASDMSAYISGQTISVCGGMQI